MTSQKNMPLQSAYSALGLGDQLYQQTEQEVLQRRKKIMSAANPKPNAYGAAGFGPISNYLMNTSGY